MQERCFISYDPAKEDAFLSFKRTWNILFHFFFRSLWWFESHRLPGRRCEYEWTHQSQESTTCPRRLLPSQCFPATGRPWREQGHVKNGWVYMKWLTGQADVCLDSSLTASSIFQLTWVVCLSVRHRAAEPQYAGVIVSRFFLFFWIIKKKKHGCLNLFINVMCFK